MKTKLSQESYKNEETVIINGRKQRHRVEVIALGPDNTVLATSIQNHPNGYVELPGGGMDKGEDIIKAAIREAEEEAGWIIDNVKEIKVNTECIVSTTDNPWLAENGYDEEKHFAVVCNAVKFQPTEKYGKEGDSHNYQLMPLHQLISETKQSMNNAKEERSKFICRFRLTALYKILNIDKVATESLPFYNKW